MAAIIYRTKPTNQELKWERMRENLKARQQRILDPDPKISNITVRPGDRRVVGFWGIFSCSAAKLQSCADFTVTSLYSLNE